MAVSTNAWGSGANKAFQWYDDTPLNSSGTDNVGWENEPSTATPLSAENLNAHSKALDIIDDRVVLLYQQMNALALGLDEVTSQFKLVYNDDNATKEDSDTNVSLNMATGDIAGTNANGSVKSEALWLIITATFSKTKKKDGTYKYKYTDIGMYIASMYDYDVGVKKINASTGLKYSCSGSTLSINVTKKFKASYHMNIRIYRL